MSELKPCPFCGAHPERVYKSTGQTTHIECPGCRAQFPKSTCANKYDDEWNSRVERTCTNGIKPGCGVMPMLYCSNCGCYTTLNKPDNATSYSESFMDWPFYCGNCGARVVSE